MVTKKMICIGCPVGCHLEVNIDAGAVTVFGNRCPRGESYAKSEISDPRRVVTAVVRSNSAAMPYIPVRSDRPVPRGRIDDLLNRLYSMTADTPVRCGDLLLDDTENCGAKIIFTADCD